MDSKTINILECDKIREFIKKYAFTPSAQKLILSINPLKSMQEIHHEQTFLKEQTDLFNNDLEIPISGLVAIDEILEKLIPADLMLEAEELIQIASFLESVKLCRQFILQHKKDIPQHHEHFSDLKPIPEIQHVIWNKINEKGEVLDSASDELKNIRKQIKHYEGKLAEKIQQILSSMSDKNILQDNYYTQRAGRYVLPIRSGSKGKIQGIIHDASQSGETLFIEPYEIIETSNDLQNLHFKEREEVRKILLSITKLVRDNRPYLAFNSSLMTQLDFIHAKARFSVEYNLQLPIISENEPIKLLSAHHPLIYLFKGSESVPIDFRTRINDKVIVITGPNTGGKTTALKTIGLNSWIALCGLSIPASPESVIPFYKDIFVDIGDEQNVTAGLSTFSSHIRNLKRILENISLASLILLDELGTATDPHEGGAIAAAVLEDLAKRSNLVIATSHLPVLKQWAHTFHGARNASFYLDEETRSPTFKLIMDVPGSSEALIIAEREGLPHKIINKAKTFLTKEEKDLSSLLMSLHEKEKELIFAKHQAAAIKEANEALKVRYENLLTEIKNKQLTFKKEILNEKDLFLKEIRQKIESRIAFQPSKQELAKIRDEVAVEQKKVSAEKKDVERRTLSKDFKPIHPDTKIGEKVYITILDDVGTLKEVDFNKNRAVINIRGKEMTLPIETISIPTEEAPQREEQPAITVSFKKKPEIKMELELHGKRVEPALAEIDRFLSDAALNSLPYVKLRHGHGTGILRRAVHDYLRTHPLAKKFYFANPNEGGSGVTVVEIK